MRVYIPVDYVETHLYTTHIAPGYWLQPDRRAKDRSLALGRYISACYGLVSIHRNFYVVVTTFLRAATITYESFTSPGKKYVKILQISVYHHSTTDVHSDNKAYELYQEFLQLLLLTSREEEEETQQLYQIIARPTRRRRPARRGVWRRILFGQHDNLLLKLNREDPASYRNLLRVGEILDRKRPNSTKNYYESFTESCEQFTCCYELFTSHLRKNQSVDTREKIFDMSKICLSFHGSLLRVVPSYLRSYLRMLASDYELVIRNDSL